MYFKRKKEERISVIILEWNDEGGRKYSVDK
jgi:hypothetical protein